MIAATEPLNERERRNALVAYDILDTAADPEFDAITALMAAICDVPMSVISFVDADRQWFKSRFGVAATETPRNVAFCAHAINDPDEIMVVPDAAADARFADNPLVTGQPGIRFYAGVPLQNVDGYAFGTVCVLDTQPRALTEHQLETLRLAGSAVELLLEQRKTIAELRHATHLQQRVEADLRAEIARRRRVEQQLSYSCSHDGLTRLPNRTEFVSRLELEFEQLKQGERGRFAVCFIDLDRFKNVNDTLGHLAGDTLLVEVGRRLSAIVRAGDAVARLGGDEFTMLINGAASDVAASAVANRIARVFAAKLRVAGADIAVTASIGIVLVDESYASLEDILRDADIAMYASKERGRNRCTLFRPALRDQFDYVTQMQLALRKAIDGDEFVLAYQPIVTLADDGLRTVGFEALLRWKQPDSSLISAANFIETAEQSGLIVEVGDWVLRQACAQARRWQLETHDSIVTAVNVSAKQLAETNFAAKVKSIVRAAGLDPRLLALEVTESILIADVDASIAIMADLRRFGIKIYLDDFGTGYSSLNYLRRFPLDRIKIDRSFVSGGPGDGIADPVIVNSIVSLAHDLGLEVVAEGVETAAQHAALAALRCNYAQGFFISAAVPAAEAALLLRPQAPAGAA